ncbi:MAG: hypothetical protein ACI81V_000209 [Lentimonas sp.]|jgi:hypothetical protein
MIQAFFNRLSLREKVLLTLFIWVLICIAATIVLKNTGRNLNRWSTVNNSDQVQAFILNRESEYDARFQEVQQRFDASYTLDETELRNRLEAICLKFNLDYSLTSSAPKQEGNFALYEVVVRLNRIDMRNLLQFHDATLEEAPYMRLDALSLSPLRGTEGELSVRFTFKSFEMETSNNRFK